MSLARAESSGRAFASPRQYNGVLPKEVVRKCCLRMRQFEDERHNGVSLLAVATVGRQRQPDGGGRSANHRAVNASRHFGLTSV
jgi:hypothetical protein